MYSRPRGMLFWLWKKGIDFMRRLSVAVVAAVSTIALTQVASAADMPVKAPAAVMPAPMNWSGFYAGANAGYGWGRRDVDFTANDPLTALLFTLGGTPPPTSYNVSGGLAGLQFGYNWQFNRAWLMGVEADLDWSGIKGSGVSNFLLSGSPSSANIDERVKWFGTVRVRLGYLPTDNLLTYVTGGFAYADIERSGSYSSAFAGGILIGTLSGFSANCPGPGTCFVGSSSKVTPGWTLGGGLEYAVWQNLTLKAEYLYMRFDSKSLNETIVAVFTPGVTPTSFNANFSRTDLNVVRVGANWHF